MLRDETQVVYVSPLKALSNDIRKNLNAPLCGIRAARGEQGLATSPHLFRLTNFRHKHV